MPDTYPKYSLPSGGWTTDQERADRLWAKARGTTADTELMARYRAEKDEYDRLIRECTDPRTPGDLWPPAVRAAQARVDAMKAEAGEGQPGDPLCCQRYGRLHLPQFAVSGCRWYPLKPKPRTGCEVHPLHLNPHCQTCRDHNPEAAS